MKVVKHLSIFTVFLKNRNFISKIRISKVTDYAALRLNYHVSLESIISSKSLNNLLTEVNQE